jgi:NAD(P)-dependent dehydrogenase (short-subunit alcohol dehydrogenase family)
MELEFADKVIVVAGGVGQLGGPVTSGFVARGARVIIPFISEMKLAAFVSEYPAFANDVRFHRVDLANEKMVERFAKDLRRIEKRVDVLVNLTGGYEPNRPIVQSDLSEFTAMMKINFTSVYLLTRRIIHFMSEQGGGKIVNVGSRAALQGYSGGAAYSIAKSAVVRFTEALSDEVKYAGINVNCVLPGILDTPRNRAEMPDAPHHHWVAAEELAQVIFFLASERARAIHGAAIPVYGLA